MRRHIVNPIQQSVWFSGSSERMEKCRRFVRKFSIWSRKQATFALLLYQKSRDMSTKSEQKFGKKAKKQAHDAGLFDDKVLCCFGDVKFGARSTCRKFFCYFSYKKSSRVPCPSYLKINFARIAAAKSRASHGAARSSLPMCPYAARSP